MQAHRVYTRHDSGPGVCDVHQDIPGEFVEDMMLDYYKSLHICITNKVLRNRVCYKQSKCYKQDSLKHVDGRVKKGSDCIIVWSNSQAA